MQLFLQGFVLTVCAGGFVTVVLGNALKVRWPLRVLLGVIFAALAYYTAGNLQRGSPPVTKESPPVSSPAPPAQNPTQTASIKQTEAAGQPTAPLEKQTAGALELASLPIKEASSEPGGFPEPRKPCRTLCAEVLYEGPTAAAGVINPRDIMAKELSDAGIEVLLAGAAAPPKSTREAAPAAPAPPARENPVPHETVVPRSPGGLTVKEIFDFVRKAQQGEWINAPEPASSFLSLSTPLFAASPPTRGLVVVAMRAAMRHLNENQGIFSTEANMQIAAVTSDGKRIQSLVMMAGPETVRGFGLDWDRAEETALRDISSKMCPQFAKDLQQKLAGEK